MLWLHPALRTLVTLACVQSGLPNCARAQSHLSVSKQVNRIIAYAHKEWNAGHSGEALKLYFSAQRAAQRAGDVDSEAKAWLGICAADTDLEVFGDGAKACNNSYRLGLQAGNKTWAGGAAASLASLYRSMGEYSLAEKESREALALLADSPRMDFLANALLFLADLEIERGRTQEGIALSDRGIGVARQGNLPEMEALLWDVRGFALLKTQQLTLAGEALQHAQAVRVNGKETSWLSVVLGHRSELALRQGHYSEALQLNDMAFATHSGSFEAVPPYYFVHVRAQILLALNRKIEALAQFRRAVNLANQWREAALPGDATNTQTVVYLNEVYHDFGQLAAELALAGHNRELSREALEVLAQNRAASLREQLTKVLARDPKFGDRYFELLSELKSAQAHVTLGSNSTEDAAKLNSIRLELSELENQSLKLSTKKEKYRVQNSLKGIQARLHPSEVLLSFSLGKATSYLWAVTADDVELYELPNKAEIEQRAKRLADALQNSGRAEAAASALSRTLFGPLSRRAWQKRDWLITEDGTSAGQVAYAALTDIGTPGSSQPLIANHSLRVLPSELLLLAPAAARPLRRFVGIADPIYNLADSRRERSVRLVPTGSAPASATLGRLAGSEREIKAAAKSSGMPKTEILAGPTANGAALREALVTTPELLHFAVHVVSPDGKPQEAALALSLTDENMPELLTREAIAAYRVPGSLVILSGCSSGQGKALPSAGLIGLGRAWLLAGATAVVVSSWPVPDDSGEFFSAFYGHLQTTVSGSLAERAATALEKAQLDMRRSSGYRTSPSFWAAYSILSKE